MSYNIVEIKCPGCGARVSVEQKECEYCRKPIVVSTFNSIYSMSAVEVRKSVSACEKALTENPDDQVLNEIAAMCYLKLGLYDKALLAFENAIENNLDNSETFFYAAVCLLQGKKAFLHQRPTIDKILMYLSAALQIEPKGIYYYFLAYIKYDYFKRKFLNTTPSYQEALDLAAVHRYSDFDVKQLFSVLAVENPFEAQNF